MSPARMKCISMTHITFDDTRRLLLLLYHKTLAKGQSFAFSEAFFLHFLFSFSFEGSWIPGSYEK